MTCECSWDPLRISSVVRVACPFMLALVTPLQSYRNSSTQGDRNAVSAIDNSKHSRRRQWSICNEKTIVMLGLNLVACLLSVPRFLSTKDQTIRSWK